MIYSEAGRALAQTLESTEGWVFTEYTLTHKPTNTTWWIGNGWIFLDGYEDRGTPNCLRLIERLPLWRKIKTLRSRTVAARLRGLESTARREEQ